MAEAVPHRLGSGKLSDLFSKSECDSTYIFADDRTHRFSTSPLTAFLFLFCLLIEVCRSPSLTFASLLTSFQAL